MRVFGIILIITCTIGATILSIVMIKDIITDIRNMQRKKKGLPPLPNKKKEKKKRKENETDL